MTRAGDAVRPRTRFLYDATILLRSTSISTKGCCLFLLLNSYFIWIAQQTDNYQSNLINLFLFCDSCCVNAHCNWVFKHFSISLHRFIDFCTNTSFIKQHMKRLHTGTGPMSMWVVKNLSTIQLNTCRKLMNTNIIKKLRSSTVTPALVSTQIPRIRFGLVSEPTVSKCRSKQNQRRQPGQLNANISIALSACRWSMRHLGRSSYRSKYGFRYGNWQ